MKRMLVALLLTPLNAWAQNPTDCVGEEAVPLECFLDVQCPQFSGYEDVRRAVVQIYGPDTWGTGVLINNASCKFGEDDDDCGTPYVLTAAHLVTDIWDTEVTPNDIASLESEFSFTLGFWTPFCGSALNGYGYALGGSQVLDWSIAKDLLLLRLETSPPPEAGAYYVGWGANDVFDEVAAISHPCGGPQKIAIADPTMIEYQAAIGVDWLHVWSWDEGAVRSASSGGPLFADSGDLLGIFSKQDVDVCAGAQSSTSFVALSSIIPFLGSVANGWASYEAYDPNEYLPVYDVVTNDDYFGSGEVVQITATQKVTLSNGFHADEGSMVHVIIVPTGP